MKKITLLAAVAALFLLAGCSIQQSEQTEVETTPLVVEDKVEETTQPQVDVEVTETLEDYFHSWLDGDEGDFYRNEAENWSYQVTRSEEAVQSILFTGLETGGAYPVNLLKGITFCWDENQQVVTKDNVEDFLVEGNLPGLMDLLVATEDYVTYAEYVTAEQIEENLNLAICYWTETDFVIQFEEGILGPHALGAPAFSISTEMLMDILPIQ